MFIETSAKARLRCQWFLGSCDARLLDGDRWKIMNTKSEVNWDYNRLYTSSTAQGSGGSFKNRKPIGEICCCESGMAERSHWWTERCLISLSLSLSFSLFLSLSLSFSLFLSLSLSFSLFLSFSLCFSTFLWLSTYLPTYLPTYLLIYLSVYLSI